MSEHIDENANEPEFSLHDFTKWMSVNARTSFNLSKSWKVGTEIEPDPSVGYRKFLSKMEPSEGEISEVAKEFKRNGGVIAEVDGMYFRVEVVNGSFVIPKTLVQRRD